MSRYRCCLPILGIFILIGTIGFADVVFGSSAQNVQRELAKVGVERVLSVNIINGDDKVDGDTLQVQFKLLVSFPECVDGEAFWFKEGTWKDSDLISYWGAKALKDCKPKREVELEQVVLLEVGKTHRYVFRGAGKWDQRISFRLDKDKKQVNALMINRSVAP